VKKKKKRFERRYDEKLYKLDEKSRKIRE